MEMNCLSKTTKPCPAVKPHPPANQSGCMQINPAKMEASGHGASSSRCGPSGCSVNLCDLDKVPETLEFFELLGPDYRAGSKAGVLLPMEPLDGFPAGAPELEPGLFELPVAIGGSLLYPEPWSAPGCPSTKKPSLAAPRGGSTLTKPLHLLYPPVVNSPGGDDGPGPLASFGPFFSDCVLLPLLLPPPHQVSYDLCAGYGRTAYCNLWRPKGVWEGDLGEEGAPWD